MKTVFTIDELNKNPGYFVIRPNHDEFFLEHTCGSFNLICARLLGMPYGDYLIFCADQLGASILGRNDLYPTPIMKKAQAEYLAKELNKRANIVLEDRKNDSLYN